jgi:hypothetical protein
VALGARRAAAPAQIPVTRRRNRPGKGRRAARGSPSVDLCPRMGGGEPEAAAAGSASASSRARDEPRAARWVPVGLGEGLGRQCGVGHG